MIYNNNNYYYYMSSKQVNINASDLWKIADRQISKLQPQQKVRISNSNSKKQMSIQSIFRDVTAQDIQQILPKNSMQAVINNNRQLPSSVRFLDYYAQKMGFLPMGQIYETEGQKYIGRSQQVSKRGQIYYKGFPKFNCQRGIQTPNLLQTLSYKSINAIQKWNQFVLAQQQLATFLQNAKTPQLRKNLIIKYAKGCSLGTDYLKILSSIYYLYSDQKSPNTNFFRLQNPKKVKSALQGANGLPLTQVLKTIMDILKGNDNFEVIINFRQDKLQSILASISKQQQSLMNQYLNDQNAYVPDQMIKQNVLIDDQWMNNLRKVNQYNSKIVTKNWPVKQSWFKPINYF